MFHQDVVTTPDDANDPRLQGSHWNKRHIWVAEDEPDDPALNTSIVWMSNGTGEGSNGDIMIKVNSGGVVKTATLLDFSILS